ncbi:MAG: hypothetical protein WAZ60_03390 [Desulfosalsimonadaceae bacterium]
MSNMETVKKIEEEIFTPGLQKAVQQTREKGYKKDEALIAAANAYGNMLVSFLGGKEQALEFLKSQVSFLETQT